MRKTRLVCRTLSHRSAFTFGSRFFTHLVVIPHTESLTVLLRYAHHQRFSRFVKTLSISGETGPPSTTYPGIHASTVEDMLTEALRSFENLETMRIDTCSYLRLEHLSSEAIGLRCGPERLRMEQLQGSFTALHHLIQVMMRSVERAMVRDKICLDLSLRFRDWSTLPPSPRACELFDLSLPYWKDSLSSKVLKLEVTTLGTGRWSHNLAASCSSLQELSLLPHRGHVKFGNAQGGLHIWPHLRSLAILGGCICITSAVFNDFFKMHKNTLVRITLKHVSLQNESWSGMLQTIYGLPALQNICFAWLSQRIAYPALEPCSDRVSTCRQGVACSNRSDVLLVMGALLPDAYTFEFGYRDGINYQIDFTLANAALLSAWSVALSTDSPSTPWSKLREDLERVWHGDRNILAWL